MIAAGRARASQPHGRRAAKPSGRPFLAAAAVIPALPVRRRRRLVGDSGSASSPADARPPGSDPTVRRESVRARGAPVRPDRSGPLRSSRSAPRRRTGRQPDAPFRAASGRPEQRAAPSSTSASSGSESQPSQGRSRAVPAYSRPRDGRKPDGTAVERTSPPYSGGGYYPWYHYYPYYPGYVYDPFYSFYYGPYYNNYAYWSPFGYGYGSRLLLVRSVPVRRNGLSRLLRWRTAPSAYESAAAAVTVRHYQGTRDRSVSRSSRPTRRFTSMAITSA